MPDFSKYMSKGSGSSNALFSYFMVGTLGAISAAGAKSTIQGELFSIWVHSLFWRGGPRGAGSRHGGVDNLYAGAQIVWGGWERELE